MLRLDEGMCRTFLSILTSSFPSTSATNRMLPFPTAVKAQGPVHALAWALFINICGIALLE